MAFHVKLLLESEIHFIAEKCLKNFNDVNSFYVLD